MEKSFRRSELVGLVRRLGLSDVRVSGIAPTHGIDRLTSRRWWLRGARFVHPLVDLADRLSGGAVTRNCGFEILVSGTKTPARKGSP